MAAAPDPPHPLLSHVLSAEPRVSGVLFFGLGRWRLLRLRSHRHGLGSTGVAARAPG